MASHKSNVYLDLSGWAPRYFPPQLVQCGRRLLEDRVLFGSDWPVLTPQRWLEEFEQLVFREDVKPKVLLTNAQRLFDLE